MTSDGLPDVDRRLPPLDVARARERRRRQRLLGVLAALVAVAGWPAYRLLSGRPPDVPSLTDVDPMYLMSGAFFVMLTVVLLGTTVVCGSLAAPGVPRRSRSTSASTTSRASTRSSEDVVRSLDLFLARADVRRRDGRHAAARPAVRRACPGTGKTHLAKAMAAEAGVPFLFVSATAFQSMYYGATARKIRSYFRALRKAARAEGGAIGFIEEIDAIAMTRGGLAPATVPRASALRRPSRLACGCRTAAGPIGPRRAAAASGYRAGASARLRRRPDRTARSARASAGSSTSCSCRCSPSTSPPAGSARGLVRRRGQPAAAGAPAAAAPATRRRPTSCSSPRRTVRTTSTPRCCARAGSTVGSPSTLPDKAGRRELVDHFLARKAHDPALDDDERRDALARHHPGLHARS